ncbi:hypothetical protein ABW19_dt0208323 [Dactylella cylindrospora]|nr:hypothetical protein ABW19_dt0208323 [Dactylella cylindrospora]
MSDDQPLEPNQEAFWKGYFFSIRNFIFPEQSQSEVFFAAPQNTVGILAGQFVPPPVTNYGIYKWGDGLLSPTQPIYLGSGSGSYTLSLQQYLSWVDLQGDTSGGAYNAYLAAIEKAKAQQTIYLSTLKDATDIYKANPQAYPSLDQWATDNYPQLLEDREAWKAAVGSELQLREQVYGAQADTLNGFVQTLINALSSASEPSLNMQVTLANVELDAAQSLLAAQGQQVTFPPFTPNYAPAYGIEGPFQDQILQWSQDFTSGKLTPTEIDIEVSKYANSSWEDAGMRSIQGEGYAGIFFGIGGSYSRKDEWDKTFNSMTADDFQCKVQIYGNKIFPLQTGPWDIPNVVGLFPKLRAGAPEDMMDLIKPAAAVMAYAVGMEIKFSDQYAQAFSSHWKTVQSFEGGLCIFGFDIGLGGSWNETDETTTHSAEYDEQSGTLTIKPANDGRSVLLGMLGQTLRQTPATTTPDVVPQPRPNPSKPTPGKSSGCGSTGSGYSRY